METRNCQNCKTSFVITDEDLNFYTKVEVPPPTFCPSCRAQRRMSFLNERTFYKRKCDLTGESIVSLFPADAEVPVYSPKAWWSDEWEATSYGMEYDFSRPFFEQFGELLLKVPQFALQNQYTTLIRTEYVNMGTYNKDCYLVFNTGYSEECAFTTFFLNGKKCLDMYGGVKNELCYEGVNFGNCYRVFYSKNCNDCVDVYFSKNLRGCTNCFGCTNLTKQSYCVWNVQYSKEEYFSEIKKYNLGSHKTVTELLQQSAEFQKQFPNRYMEGTHNTNVSGDQVHECKNVFDSYEMVGAEDSKYCQFVFYKPARDCMDMTLWGENATRIYECMGAGSNEDMIKFSFDCWAQASNIEYSYHITTANNNLFGCVGLKNKDYCILNKQYSKEEYEALIPKIKKHMNEMPYVDKRGLVYKYGEFFPSEISLFAYNESFANNYFPLDESEVKEQGFRWKEIERGTHEITMRTEDLPDDIRLVSESVTKEVIECAVSKRAFRITPAEFQFYKEMNIPLPHLHPDERHKLRLEKQNPMRLWNRKCMNSGCQNDFQTSYSPERMEIVYCESCYQQEVN
jgi:Zn ribbon nucleic-acid-binding protein